ncbi:MAG: hypothetical protein AB8E15_02140 [Bdellovibrionales bacterium]
MSLIIQKIVLFFSMAPLMGCVIFEPLDSEAGSSALKKLMARNYTQIPACFNSSPCRKNQEHLLLNISLTFDRFREFQDVDFKYKEALTTAQRKCLTESFHDLNLDRDGGNIGLGYKWRFDLPICPQNKVKAPMSSVARISPTKK